MPTTNTVLRRHRQSGFAFLEVLIAVVIVGFGVISIGKFFSVSMLNSGFARQQTIALSLADSKIEELRAYGSLTTYDAISTSTDTNGDYTISWSITPSTANVGHIGEYKEINVTVTWTDLQGVNRATNATSIIGATDPNAIAHLLKNYAPPGNPIHPFDRVLKVPIPAINQGDGTSSYAPPGTTGVSILLDNTSGNVVGGTGIPTNIAGATAYYLLSGYISFGSGSRRPTIDAEDNIDITLSVSASNYTCWDDSHLSSAQKVYPDYITYSCVVKGLGATVPVWSGTLSLTLNHVSHSYWSNKVCRFDDTLASYTDISETLANQNFMIIKGNRSCESGSEEF